MPSVLWVCYQCRTSMPDPGACTGCQQALLRYPPSPTPSPAPALPELEEDKDEVLQTLKFRGVIPLPPTNVPIPAASGSDQSLSRSQEILKDTFEDIMNDDDSLTQTLRFRGVMKVPETKLQTAPKVQGGAPAAKAGPKKIPTKRLQNENIDLPSEENTENLAGILVIVAIISLVIGVSLTTVILSFVVQ
jgi:hypothetical protein